MTKTPEFVDVEISSDEVTVAHEIVAASTDKPWHKKESVMEWQDVSYEVTSPPIPEWLAASLGIQRERKQILDHAYGRVASGELLAIMGPSGSGKTTLLNTLAGRATSGRVTGGAVLVGGLQRTKHWRHQHGYVEQEEIMHQHLTVQETLRYAALLQLPKTVPLPFKLMRVRKIMTDLGLLQCAHTAIKRISGGERKRCSIGVELLKSPAFLLLDEPTSGLDSFMALSLIECLYRLATDERKAIVMTIHQPRSTIMNMFTNVLLLSQGRTVYFGSVPGALELFESQGLQCPSHVNPTDFLLDNIIVDSRTSDSRRVSQARVDALVTATRAHERKQPRLIMPPLSAEQRKMRWSRFVMCMESEHWRERPGVPEQFALLLTRNLKDHWRFNSAVIALVLQTIILSIFVSLVFWQMPLTQSSIQNRMGVIFFLVTQEIFAFVMPLTVVLPMERQMISRERTSVSYKASSVYLAKVFSVVPQAAFGVVVLGTIVYWAINLQRDLLHFGVFMGMLMSLVLCSQALGMIIGALVPNTHVALIVGPMITLMFVVFAGNIINSSQIPDAFAWISYISPCNYAYKALMQNEFQGLEFECPPVPPGQSSPCFATGEQVLQFFDVNGTDIWQCALFLWVLTVSFHCVGYLSLRISTRPKVRV